MKKDVLIFIGHIFESIERIEEYTKNLTKEELIQNLKIQDAIIKSYYIIIC